MTCHPGRGELLRESCGGIVRKDQNRKRAIRPGVNGLLARLVEAVPLGGYGARAHRTAVLSRQSFCVSIESRRGSRALSQEARNAGIEHGPLEQRADPLRRLLDPSTG